MSKIGHLNSAIEQLEELQEKWFIKLINPLMIEPILEDLYNLKREIE